MRKRSKDAVEIEDDVHFGDEPEEENIDLSDFQAVDEDEDYEHPQQSHDQDFWLDV